MSTRDDPPRAPPLPIPPCCLCRGFSREPLWRDGRTLAQATLLDFSRSRLGGCRLCTLVCNAAAVYSKSWIHLSTDGVLIHVDESIDMSKTLHVVGSAILGRVPLHSEWAQAAQNSRRLFTAELYCPPGEAHLLVCSLHLLGSTDTSD